MRRLNFITGLINKLLGTIIAFLGIALINTLTGCDVFQLNITEVYKVLGIKYISILGVIELVAIYLFIRGSKDLVDSAKYINWEEHRKVRVFETLFNLTILTLLLGAEVYGIVTLVLKKFDITILNLGDTLIYGTFILFTLILVILLFVKLIRININQRPYKRPRIRKEKKNNKINKIEKTDNSKIEKSEYDFIKPKFNIGKK